MNEATNTNTNQKVCPVCGSVFTPHHYRQRYCSQVCALHQHAIQCKQWIRDNYEKYKQDQRDYYHRHPDKHCVRVNTRKKVRQGEIKLEPCELCGTTDNVQIHHIDYSGDKYMFLCRDCNVKVRMANRRIQAHLAATEGNC